MAKLTSKVAAKAPKKAAAPKPKATSSALAIDKVSQDVLKVLFDLDLGGSLQADLTWCLGSYKHDQNPAGLYEIMEKTHALLLEEQKKKTKGVTAKMIKDMETILKSR